MPPTPPTLPPGIRAPTERQLETATRYADFMEEAKVRVQCINDAVRGNLLLLPGAIVQEFGFLQLRMLCELVAVGCLIAHGDIEATQASKLQTAYAADKLIKRLGELHPKFYPYPIVIRVFPPSADDPKGRVHLDDAPAGFLTKEEFLRLYHLCGDRLHRGSAEKLRSEKHPQQLRFPEIAQWSGKFMRLLNQHRISSPDSRFHYIVNLADPGLGGRVSVATASSPSEG